MKRAFITGATGQDGSYLSELLLDKEYEVFGLVRMSSVNNIERLSNVINNQKFHVLYGDMTDETSIFKALYECKPDEIYNLAAQSHVGLSDKYSEYTANINSFGFLRLINSIRNLHLEEKIKIYNASTAEIFGNKNIDVYTENSPLNPITPYACSKAYTHMLAKAYRNQGIYIVNGISFPHESPRRPVKFVTRKITKTAAKIKLGLQDKLSLGNIYVKKDWGYAKDYVKAMYLSLQQERPDDYIFSTGIHTSVKEFCVKAFECLDIQLEFQGEGLNEKAFDMKTGKLVIDINPEFYRKYENPAPKGDNSKAKKILNWQPSVTIDELIREMVEEDYKKEKVLAELVKSETKL